ncbi:MAG TPA: beta-N-acetylhexosaminidase [Gemmatimonadaceae bacterium]|nr:beta-N-acetylhexosaminidase [Gemmatimonadaceae bacterium]
MTVRHLRPAALLALALLARPAAAQSLDPVLAVVPRPMRVERLPGVFTLRASTAIYTDRESTAVGRQLAAYLAPATGYTLPVRTGTPLGNRIVLRRDTSLAELGAEGYRLEVRPGRVTVRAPAEAGLFYGVQTLRQLLPPAIFREAPVDAVAWTVPALVIMDRPRFAWRGLHLDVSRHYMPREFVRKYIDLLALHKLNTFHWHLTDDQGWRLEIRKYPKLTEVGAWRRETMVGRYMREPAERRFDGREHGGFYTQDDVREIVAYARQRHVTVVPEIDMPGHTQAAIAAYPELGTTGATLPVLTSWGGGEDVLNAEQRTVSFMQDVLAEVLELFPSQFIHVGGDEVLKRFWRESPRTQELMRQRGLTNEDELQSWFIRQMDAWLTRRGRRLMGWDEILEGGLAPGAAVMSWRGTAGGIAAARDQHDVVMSPNDELYFDHYQSRDREAEPLAIGGFTPLDSVYAYEPVPAELEPRFQRHVLGAQANVWTEYIRNPKEVEYMVFPRAAALAEVVWTPRASRDWGDFRRRLDVHLRRLDALDVRYRSPEPARAATPADTR